MIRVGYGQPVDERKLMPMGPALRRATARVVLPAVLTGVAISGVALAAAAPGAAAAAGQAPPTGVERVVVRGSIAPGDLARLVERSGGKVTRTLPIISGVAATVPAARLAALRAANGVLEVTPDRKVAVLGSTATG